MFCFGFKRSGQGIPRTGLLLYLPRPNYLEGLIWDAEATYLWDEETLSWATYLITAPVPEPRTLYADGQPVTAYRNYWSDGEPHEYTI